MRSIDSLSVSADRKQELLYGITNPPENLNSLTTQLENYYRSSQVVRIKAMYGTPSTFDASSASDRSDLRTLYGRMVADGQVYVPSRSLVKVLFDHGVSMDRILRYRLTWRPKGTDRIALFP
jgi:hypothetical protein